MLGGLTRFTSLGGLLLFVWLGLPGCTTSAVPGAPTDEVNDAFLTMLGREPTSEESKHLEALRDLDICQDANPATPHKLEETKCEALLATSHLPPELYAWIKQNQEKSVRHSTPVASSKPPQETKAPASALEQMKKFLSRRQFQNAARLARSIQPPPRANLCYGSFTFSKYALALAARYSQRRDDFHGHQAELVALLHSESCTAEQLEMSKTEFTRFVVDARLWLARLLWERGHLEPAFKHALQGFIQARKEKEEDLALEAVQIAVGRIGYETRTPTANLHLLAFFADAFAWSPQSQIWLLSRRALFEFLARRHTDAIATWENLLALPNTTSEDRALANFWMARSHLANKDPNKAVLAFRKAAESDRLGYYDAVGLQLLKQVPESPSTRAELTLPSRHEIETSTMTPLRAWKPAQEPDANPLLKTLRLSAIRVRALNWSLTDVEFLEAFKHDTKPSSRFIKQMLKDETAQIMKNLRTPPNNIEELSQLWQATRTLAHLNAAVGNFRESILLVARLRGSEVYKDPDDRDLLPLYYPRPYLSLFAKASSRCETQPNLLYAIGRQESLFQVEVKSIAGAVGLLQLLPTTGKKHHPKPLPQPFDLTNPEINAHAGACYIAHLLRHYNGDTVFALAAYNAGEGAVDEWIKRRHHSKDILAFIEMVPYSETQNYVKKVLRNYFNIKWLYETPKETP